jgi:hypothetical protein
MSEILSKSSQETAAQMMDVYPYFSDQLMPEGYATKMSERADELRAEIEAMDLSMLSNDELALKLSNIKQVAVRSGTWDPTKGEGAEERIAFAQEQVKRFGYDDDEAAAIAIKDLQGSGYLEAIRMKRKEQEHRFRDPINEYVGDHALDGGLEKQEIDGLLKRTIDLTTLTTNEFAQLAHDFPSGNFLYHGAGTDQLVKIIDSGVLVNAKALYEREDQAAQAEGREAGMVSRNSGYEGISWSMNGIDALPGDRYHMAGFVAAPEAVLPDGAQLAIPKRPSPNEVILLDGTIDANLYYEVNTQVELYEAHSRNSVLGGLLELAIGQTMDGETPQLKKLAPKLESDPELEQSLKGGYETTVDNAIVLSPDLLSAEDTEGELPVAAVWLQALVDTDRLESTVFRGMNTSEVINAVNDENIQQLYNELHKDVDAVSGRLESEPGNVEVPVENMYFVAPRKDAEAWLKVIARSQHKPAGIMLYDDKKVRLENFASAHKGDHAELTQELQAAIIPDNEEYISYAAVLGLAFTDDMRAGHKRQVIAERHLANRSTIRKIDDRLVVGK